VYLDDKFGYFTIITKLYSLPVISGTANHSLQTELSSDMALRKDLKVRGDPNYAKAMMIHSD